MSLRFWSIVIPILVIAAGAIIIYMDYSDQQEQQSATPNLPEHDHVHEEELDATAGSDTAGYESEVTEPDSADLARILEIEEAIEETDNTSLKIAYFGEIIQRYMEYDRLDGAGDAGIRLAELSEEPDDWINAGDWFFAWLDKEPNRTRAFYFASRAAQAYGRALEDRPDDYELRTDKAAALLESGNPERAEEELKAALEVNPEYLDANYNLGVILHQTGSKDESISYLRRSIELAEGTDRQEIVEQFIEENDISL